MKINLTYSFDSEEELRAHLGGETRATEPTAPVAAPTPDAPVAEPTEDQRSDDAPEVDSDGMPYDPDIHTGTKTLNEDGTWKAKRGMADKAKHARAAFKAGGGDVEAPDTAEREDEPVKSAEMPGMPGAIPSEAPTDVGFEELMGKISGMMGRKAVDGATMTNLYNEVGSADPNEYQTNSTLRSALYEKLCEIEPEMA